MIHHRGQRLALPLLEQQAAFVRRALPDLAEQILAEPGWLALATALNDTSVEGHNPTALLAEAARHRELDTATSISEVLTWRLARLHDPAVEVPVNTNSTRSAPPGSATTVQRGSGARSRSR
ncbi:hypothetical protein ACWGGS_32950 [Streptomyces decoyicus]